jgi:SAM-dependent methyltransferase
MTTIGTVWDVDSYERGRPDYPAEAVDLLISRMQLGPNATVLDLAAGNGRLTRPLVERFEHVIAVEPHVEMRKALGTAAPQAEVLAGVAEAIPLTSRSVDAVFVGSAFHWFDAGRALPEIARVLRPGGALGLIIGRWDRTASAWGRQVDRVLSRHGSLPAAGWRDHFAASDLFEPLEETVVNADQEQDREGVLARVASISFIAALPASDRDAVLREVGRILDSDPDTRAAASLPMPHRIELCWTHKR